MDPCLGVVAVSPGHRPQGESCRNRGVRFEREVSACHLYTIVYCRSALVPIS